MFESCFYIEPDDVIKLLSCRRRTAKVSHKCGECKCVIQPGDIYEVDVGVFEDSFGVYKTCLPCLNIRNSLFQSGWYYGHIWTDIHEEYCNKDECICPK